MVVRFVVNLNSQSEKEMMLLNRNTYFTGCSLDRPYYFFDSSKNKVKVIIIPVKKGFL